MARVLGSRHCLVCGRDNRVGMHLRFRVDGDGAEAAWASTSSFQGFPGVLHGGIVLSLCDDAMWYAAFGRGAFTMTAEASVRYRTPVRIGLPLVIRGWVTEHRGRLWTCAAELAAAEGDTVLATAAGKFLPVPPQLLDRTCVHEYPEPERQAAP